MIEPCALEPRHRPPRQRELLGRRPLDLEVRSDPDHGRRPFRSQPPRAGCRCHQEKLIFTSLDETSDLKGAAFSQDGSRIALFYSDGRILVRAIAFDDVLEIAKGVSRARSRTPSAACTSTHQRAGPTLQERQAA